MKVWQVSKARHAYLSNFLTCAHKLAHFDFTASKCKVVISGILFILMFYRDKIWIGPKVYRRTSNIRVILNIRDSPGSGVNNTVVFSEATKSTAYSSLPKWAGEERVSTLTSLSSGIGNCTCFLQHKSYKGYSYLFSEPVCALSALV